MLKVCSYSKPLLTLLATRILLLSLFPFSYSLLGGVQDVTAMFASTADTRDTMECACSSVLPELSTIFNDIIEDAYTGNSTKPVLGPFAVINSGACVGGLRADGTSEYLAGLDYACVNSTDGSFAKCNTPHLNITAEQCSRFCEVERGESKLKLRVEIKTTPNQKQTQPHGAQATLQTILPPNLLEIWWWRPPLIAEIPLLFFLCSLL